MRKLLVIVFAFAYVGLAAQHGFFASASGRYMMADEWDEIVRTYNFSRPNVEEKMRLFSFGWNAEAGYFRQIKPRFGCFGTLGFHRTTSQAYSSAAHTGGSEYQLRASINCLTADAGVRIVPFKQTILSSVFVDVSPGFALLMPRVKLNGEREEVAEDEIYRPFSPAFRMMAGVGTQFNVNARWVICPFFRTEYFVGAELTDFAGMVTGSYLPDLDDESPVLTFQLGLQLRMSK
ncbi:MAG: hypothetical protein MUC87_04465 [Bacteroidia bacterium]|jgi:hypothetical protein|nr:hypothetical protein [Bacteroidia bacterium]